ncbi:DUF2092 domain-containing protein [Luteimonas sp. A482]
MTVPKRNCCWRVMARRSLLLALAPLSPAFAQDSALPSPRPDASATLEHGVVITADAQAVLDRMRATFDRMRSYEVTARITRDEVLPFGYKLQNTETARMWVDAPKSLRVEVRGDLKNRTYVYDGAQLTTHVPDMNIYAATEAPPTLAELVVALIDLGVEMPLIDLLYQGNEGSLTDNVKVGLVVGDSEVDGVMTDHLAFRQPAVDWQLWVEKGEQALPRKLVITTRYQVGDPQYQALLDWNLEGRMPASTFRFVAPSGAVQVPSVMHLAASGEDK